MADEARVYGRFFPADLEHKITTWQRQVDLKVMNSVWAAHVRTPEEDELSEQ